MYSPHFFIRPVHKGDTGYEKVCIPFLNQLEQDMGGI